MLEEGEEVGAADFGCAPRCRVPGAGCWVPGLVDLIEPTSQVALIELIGLIELIDQIGLIGLIDHIRPM